MAVAGKRTASAVEQALICAIARRFPRPRPASIAELARWERDYTDAMRLVHREYPHDHDVAALFAEALITLTPWKLWDTATGKPAEGAATLEALRTVEEALQQQSNRNLPPHPGLLHMHIHLLEMSTTPEQALGSADALAGIAPDSGHLEHMPCHVYAFCGQFHRAIDASAKVIAADRKNLAHAGANLFYTNSICHDLHMMMYASMTAGRFAPALAAANETRELLTPDLIGVDKPRMAVTLEGYCSTRMHVLVRFGRWRNILADPPMADSVLHCVTTAMLHYARGIANAALGQTDAAEYERDAFAVAKARVPKNRLFFNNSAHDILRVAEAMLEGELAYRKGEFLAAFDHLREAAFHDDHLFYNEPWA